MIYLVGGVSRAGKSTFARTLRKATGGQAIAGDAFRTMLRATTTSQTHPTLHWRKEHGLDAPTAYVDYFVEHTPQAVENMRQEAREIWKYLSEYIRAFDHESSEDLIIESVDILPEFVSQLNLPVQAFFFIDTHESQWERITERLEDERHNWLQAKRLSREQIQKWAQFNAKRGQYIQKQAELYHQPYFDVGEIGYNSAQEHAFSLWHSRN